MSVASLITVAKGAGTVKVTSGGAEFPILRMEESVVVTGAEGVNGRTVTTTTLTIDSMAVAGSEDPVNVGALKASLIADLARRGDAVFLVEMGGTARTLRAGGDVSGISGAGTTTVPGYPVVTIDFDAENSVGAVVFFTLKITTMEVTFGATSGGYNVVHANESRRIARDEAGNEQTAVRGDVRLKPGQDALAYVRDVIIAPARSAALVAGDNFSDARDRPSIDPAYATYEYTVSDSAFGVTGVSTATVIDETDVTLTSIEGRVTRSISGTVKGPNALTTAQSRRLSPVPANHLVISDTVSLPDTQGGGVTYRYEYLTGRTDARMAGTVFFRFRQSISEPSGGREAVSSVFPQGAPIVAFGPIAPWIVVERTEFEFTGTFPTEANIPRAYGAEFQMRRAERERTAEAPGLRRGSHTRVYVFSTEPAAATPAELA